MKIVNQTSISSMIEDGCTNDEIITYFKPLKLTHKQLDKIRKRNEQWTMDGIMMR